MNMVAVFLLGLIPISQLDPLTHVGTLADGLRSPVRITVAPDGTVLVSDPFSDHIARFDASNSLVGTYAVPAGPIGVAAHPDGRYFVSLRDEAKVAIFDSGFILTGYLGEDDPLVTFVRPTDIDTATDTGRIYVVDAEGDQLYGFESDGSLALTVGLRGIMSGQFRYPSAVCVDEFSGHLLVADHDNFRVQAFNTVGVFQFHFGDRLKSVGYDVEGWLPRTQGLAADAEGRIYVADALMGTVRVFDAQGTELGKVVEYGFDPDDLRVPCDLALSNDGSRLYVVSTNASSVEIYETPPWGLIGPAHRGDALPLPRGGGGGEDTRSGDRSNYEGPHMLAESVICGRCHGITGQPGSHPGTVEGQGVLCMSCHSAGGQALMVPVHESDVADPYGTNPGAVDGRGRSHAWGVSAINADADSVGPAAGGMMGWFLDSGGNIKCSTCHNQHTDDADSPYLRVSNHGDAMCKECHAARNEGLGELGTHPVGFDYPGGEGEFPADGDLAPLHIKDDNVECTTCHAPHFADSGGANDGEGDGMLLRGANDEKFCQTCHTEHAIHSVGGPWQPTCKECHDTHDPDNENLSLVASSVYNKTLDEDKPVVFTARTGPDGFGDAGPVDDGICQVCHTATTYHLYDGSGAGHYNGQDCTACHTHADGFMPSGGACDACHGQPPDSQPPIGDVFPNRAGSHAAHMSATHGPGISSCFVCHAALSAGTHLNTFVSFASGVDANGNGNIDLDETDVCDACHSPDGAFDGVNDAAFGAKANWADGVYNEGELMPGKAEWCAGCHDLGTSTIQGVSAPPVAGDNATWGFFANGHGRGGGHATGCTSCHDATSAHFDGLARTYSFDSAYYGPGQSGVAYAAGYRLRDVGGEVPLMIPANYNITFGYDASLMKATAFRLCFKCHLADKVLDDTPGDGIDSGFKASLPNPPRDYSYAWGSGADVNEHVAHILNYIGPFADSDWDAGTNGPGGADGRDSLTACSSCHNVHGAVGIEGSTNEAMIRDGALAGRPNGYGFSYVIEDVGSGGYPMVTSTGATRSNSVGSVFRYNTANMCGGMMCHGDPDSPPGSSYDATGSNWGTYLEYYRPPIPGGCFLCHDSHVDNGDGVPASGRRAVFGEFPVGDAHAHYGTELDRTSCLVCHSMGTHMDGYVELADPDDGSLYRFQKPEDLSSDPDVSDFCAGCHDADGATRLADPLAPFGSSNAAPDVASKFTGTIQWYEEYGDACFSGPYGTQRAVNSHHDISDTDQAFSGAKIECLHCHGAHTSAASQSINNPFDTLTPWTGDANSFCLACHNGGNGPTDPSFPLGVIGPSIALRGIDSCDYQGDMWYVSYDWTHSAHGLDSKRGWLGYSGAPDAVVDCIVCHNPHGSYTPANTVGNPYMIQDYVDGTAFVDDGSRSGGFNGPPFETHGIAREVIVTVGEDVEWGDEQGLCAVCHASWLPAMWAHDMCTACQNCHAHGDNWGEYDWCDGDDDTPCP
ncbi:MAG: hypothetical protein JXQ75_21885 [Phycisphaerae bacterium]|nr:hypothetical protein [Phycisphaerae bacterium]